MEPLYLPGLREDSWSITGSPNTVQGLNTGIFRKASQTVGDLVR